MTERWKLLLPAPAFHTRQFWSLRPTRHGGSKRSWDSVPDVWARGRFWDARADHAAEPAGDCGRQLDRRLPPEETVDSAGLFRKPPTAPRRRSRTHTAQTTA